MQTLQIVAHNAELLAPVNIPTTHNEQYTQ